MVEISIELKKKILDYIELVEQNGFPIRTAYLYGSYVNGENHEWSDIDLAIVSEKFDRNRFNDKMKILGLYRKIDDRISTLPLIPNDLTDSFFC